MTEPTDLEALEKASFCARDALHRIRTGLLDPRDAAVALGFKYDQDTITAVLELAANSDSTRTALAAKEREPDHQWSHDVLHDLVMLRAEEWALSGGGPGIKERWEKAWRAAEEIFEP